MRLVLPCILIWLTAVSLPARGADQVTLADARGLLQTGHYPSAGEVYQRLLDNDETPDETRTLAVLGLSRAHQRRGLWKSAADVIDSGLIDAPDDASLLARRAELHFLRGEYEEASASVKSALRIEPDNLLARLVAARLNAERGEFDEAIDGYRWFVRYYNREQPAEAASLLLIGEGALQYARWKSVSDIFGFVVNTLAVDALKNDELCWEASLLSARVLLEKYNKPQAEPEFAAALAINPRAAEVMVAQGQAALLDHDVQSALEFAGQALTINPALPDALLLAADASIATGEIQSAMEFVNQARSVNPIDQKTLARLAGIFLLDDGILDKDVLLTVLEGKFDELENDVATSRFVVTFREVLAHHPKPGVFLNDLGEILDGHRKYEAAEGCFRRAIEVMPQLSSPRTALGMLAMRTGDLEEAQSILDAAFEADPFHVRVSNMRKVLRQLVDYDTVTTEHFVIRIPSGDRLLGEAMADYLEQTYDELTTLFGYEPEARTQFEVFGPADGNSAHQWFSARMVGLPWVQTIGASTGMIVALASPGDSAQPFNWARVLRHEYVHILTLQQTRFNIPHWYTEALAVRTEGVSPPEWDTMLLRRVPAGETFTLADINSGFQRPRIPEDWQMAYCQSWLYARYLTDRFGEETHAELLDAYRRNLSTEEAILQACDIPVEEFEAGYVKYLHDHLTMLRRTRVEPALSVTQAQKELRIEPTDADRQGRLAWAMWNEGSQREALDIVRQLLATDPDQRYAVAIIAESHLDNDDHPAARRLLLDHYQADDPRPELIPLLAQVHIADRDWVAAEQVWRAGTSRWPREPQFLKGLAASLLRQDAQTGLRSVLEQLAELDADDLLSRRKLAEMSAAAQDWTAAQRWAVEALHIDITNESMHRTLLNAAEALGDEQLADRERDILQQLTE